MSMCIRTVLVPLAAANVTTRRDMEKASNTAMDRMEEKINTVMQKSIDVVITWVTKLLARQDKMDFRPRDDALGGSAWLEQLQTPVSVSFEAPFGSSMADQSCRPVNKCSTFSLASTTSPSPRFPLRLI